MLVLVAITVLPFAVFPPSWLKPLQSGELAPLADFSGVIGASPTQFMLQPYVGPARAKEKLNQNELTRSILVHLAAKRDLITQLEAFTTLARSWAGEDATSVTKGTAELSAALVASLPHDVPLPTVSSSADGEVGFAWTTRAKIVEALVDDEGCLVWLWRENGKILAGGETVCDGTFPDQLLAHLDRVA